jgi:hypothetical protein
MPELIPNAPLTGDKPEIQHTIPSVPNSALQTTVHEEPEREYVLDFLHLAHKLDDISNELKDLIMGVNNLVKNIVMERTPIDHWENVGKTIEYTIDYQGKKYLYVTATTSLTLLTSTGCTIPVVCGTWSRAFYPRGTKITVQGGSDTVPNQILFRSCDFYMG